VHPYTLRRDDLPAGFGSLDELLERLLVQLGVEGAFTDFPDVVAEFVRRRCGH
jgi:glycerophosphoryl diester phosphodiesterase